jgi:Periplasmic copper-binding protein (NosD)
MSRVVAWVGAFSLVAVLFASAFAGAIPVHGAPFAERAPAGPSHSAEGSAAVALWGRTPFPAPSYGAQAAAVTHPASGGPVLPGPPPHGPVVLFPNCTVSPGAPINVAHVGPTTYFNVTADIHRSILDMCNNSILDGGYWSVGNSTNLPWSLEIFGSNNTTIEFFDFSTNDLLFDAIVANASDAVYNGLDEWTPYGDDPDTGVGFLNAYNSEVENSILNGSSAGVSVVDCEYTDIYDNTVNATNASNDGSANGAIVSFSTYSVLEFNDFQPSTIWGSETGVDLLGDSSVFEYSDYDGYPGANYGETVTGTTDLFSYYVQFVDPTLSGLSIEDSQGLTLWYDLAADTPDGFDLENSQNVSFYGDTAYSTGAAFSYGFNFGLDTNVSADSIATYYAATGVGADLTDNLSVNDSGIYQTGDADVILNLGTNTIFSNDTMNFATGPADQLVVGGNDTNTTFVDDFLNNATSTDGAVELFDMDLLTVSDSYLANDSTALLIEGSQQLSLEGDNASDAMPGCAQGEAGVSLQNDTLVLVENDTVTNSSCVAIYADQLLEGLFEQDNLSGANAAGLYLEGAIDVTIANDWLYNELGMGLFAQGLEYATIDSTLTSVAGCGTGSALYVTSYTALDVVGDTFANGYATVELGQGTGLTFGDDTVDSTCDSTYGITAYVDTDANFTGGIVEGFGTGVSLETDTHVTFAGVALVASFFGLAIEAEDTTYLTFVDDAINGSLSLGLELEESSHLSILDSSFALYDGAVFANDSQVTIAGNSLWDTVDPLGFEYTIDFTVLDNNLSDAQVGIDIENSADGAIVGNVFASNFDSFEIESVNNLTLYHNDFIDDSGWILSGATGTTFNDSYPTGGNYWSNYTGVDLKHGPAQNVTGADGIGDTPFRLGTTAFYDRYPLMHLWTEPMLNFTEVGLPVGADWSVRVTFGGPAPGTVVVSGAASTLSVADPYGARTPFTWSVSPSSAKYVVVRNGSGASNTTDDGMLVNVSFAPFLSETDFEAQNLPSGGHLSLSVNGTLYDTASADVDLELVNGTYAWWATTELATGPVYGNVTVSGSTQVVQITLNVPTYTVEFQEVGLASGTTWSVTFNGTVLNAPTASLALHEIRGTYAYSVASVGSAHPTPGSGSLTVGSSEPTAFVSIEFQSAQSSSGYAVVFTESDLLNGASWSVTLNGQEITDSAPTIAFVQGNGSFDYTIATADGQVASPSSGTVNVTGAPTGVGVVFHAPSGISTYVVLFSESGLPSASTWGVTLNGSTQSGTGTTIAFLEANGTYPYTVTAPTSWSATPATGAVPVTGGAAGIAIVFHTGTASGPGKYTVTFTETGLPAGSSWSVTVNGTTLPGTGSTIAFTLANGTYAYTIATQAVGYDASPASGTVLVSGGATAAPIAFSNGAKSTTPSSTPSSGLDLSGSNADVLFALVALVVVLAALAAVGWMRRGGRSGGPPPTAPPPSAASAAPAAAAGTGAAAGGATDAGAAASKETPIWKE